MGRQLWDDFGADLRHGLRLLGRRRWFSLMAVLVVGLGVGLASMMFEVLHGFVWDGLQTPHGRPLYVVGLQGGERGRAPFRVGLPLSRALVEAAEGAGCQLAWYEERTVNFRVGASVQRPLSLAVSDQFLEVLGVQPLVGSGFVPGDAGSGGRRVALLGHAFWQREFRGDPAVVGRPVFLDGAPFTVLGVLPEVRQLGERIELLTPLSFHLMTADGTDRMTLLAQTHPGVSARSVEAALTTVLRRQGAEVVASESGARSVFLRPFGLAMLGDTMVLRLVMLLGFALLVLAMSCINGGLLLSAQFSTRSSELAVREALGATGARLFRQMAAEALVFTGAGCVLGLVLTAAGLRVLWLRMERLAPDWTEPFHLRGETVVFALGLLGSVVLISLVAMAWRETRPGRGGGLRQQSRSYTGVRLGHLTRSMVMSQLALAFALLAGMVLMARSLLLLNEETLPVDPEQVVTARISLRGQDYKSGPGYLQFFAQLIARLEAAGVAGPIALSERDGLGRASRVAAETPARERLPGMPTPGLPVFRDCVSVDYFAVAGIEAQQGRLFTPIDTAESLPVAVVNRSFVEKFFGEGDAIGRQFRDTVEADGLGPWLTIVGVVPDFWLQGLFNYEEHGAGFYRPVTQQGDNAMSLVLRRPKELSSWERTLRETLYSLDPDETTKEVTTWADEYRDRLATPRLVMLLLTLFGAAAGLEALFGIFALLLFLIRNRQRELGIRLALGAQPGDLWNQLLREQAPPAGLGLLAGLGLAVLTAAVLRQTGLLGQLPPWDPATYLAVALLLLAGMLAAIWWPLRQAGSVEVLQALREE